MVKRDFIARERIWAHLGYVSPTMIAGFVCLIFVLSNFLIFGRP